MFADAISLYEPIDRLKPLAEGIGIVDGPLVYMTYPGLKFLKIPFPTRMTVVKLATGELWLHSPIAYDAKLAEALSAMGPIRHLVSPNKIHYAHIKAWKDAIPDAVAWASPGVRERARSQGIQVRFDKNLGKEAPDAWRGDLLQTVIPGSFLDEVVFLHKKSRTLILADTIQNFDLDKIKQPYRFLVWAAGAYDPRGQMPIDLRSTFWPKKRAVGAAVAEMIGWKPERIVLSHGRCIEKDAVEALRYAFRWAL
jgi:hypothetical protein